MNQLRQEFKEILHDVALEYNVDLPEDFVCELFEQMVELFSEVDGDEEDLYTEDR